MIKTSLDWGDERESLRSKIVSLPHNRDLRKMLNNIDKQVSDLGKAEVIARRNHKNIDNLPELKAVNASIETIEKWIIFAALMG